MSSAPAAAVDLPFEISPPLPHVREYRDEDAEAVARMWRESAIAWPSWGPGGGEHSTAARVRQEHRDLNALAVFLVFRPDAGTGEERAVGYCSLFEYAGEVNTAYVGTLSAHPDWHGQGIGRDLLWAALRRTVELGYARLDLNTWAGNLKAVPLYKKSGYFWAPDTSVKMENYLPLIFRLPPAQAFFRQADWYRDFRRDLSLAPDEEKRGKAEVYTYAWEHDGRRLKVVIDRRARGVCAIETDDLSASLELDDPLVPIGGRRLARWRVENHTGRPVSVSVLADGEGAVRCALQASATVERTQEWSAAVSAEQPAFDAPPNRPSNRVRSTLVVDGQPLQLLAGTRPVQPVDVSFESGKRWLVPGVERRMWLTLENQLDETASGTLRLAASPGLVLAASEHEFTIGGRQRASAAVALRADQAGMHALRALAVLRGTDGERQTKLYEQTILSGELGAVFVEQDEERVRLSTDRLVLDVPLAPRGDWSVSFSIADRDSGRSILSHTCSLGPPFEPSVFTGSTWAARIERHDSATRLTLSTGPAALPGITFERQLDVSPSGLVRVVYRATNAGEGVRELQVSAETHVNLDMTLGGSRVAAPLTTGLVVEDSSRFPDWAEPEVMRPERFAESWMAEYADGWVGATLWREAKEIGANWAAPELLLDLGTLTAGASVQTQPLYLYAGQGDWRTARSVWRQLVAPESPSEPPAPRPAHRVQLERFTFDTSEGETVLALDSERTRSLSGTVALDVDGVQAGEGRVDRLSVGAPQRVPVRVALPEGARAMPATIVLDHERTTDRYAAALIRAGVRGAAVQVEAAREGEVEVVRIDNGRMRLRLIPSQMARIAELEVRDTDGAWQNQLYRPDHAPGAFVWFNPWYGGIHPGISGGRSVYPGPLERETFTWHEAEVTGNQGVRWRGVTAMALTSGDSASGVRPAAGLRISVSYLTCGESNLVAVPVTVTNEGDARIEGTFVLHAFLQPGGDRTAGVLHYERLGEERTQKRVHSGNWSDSGKWCAVAGPAGSPVVALVAASHNSWVSDIRDMGLDGAHPAMTFPLRLSPGESAEALLYYVVADDVAQARLYRHLADAPGLV